MALSMFCIALWSPRDFDAMTNSPLTPALPITRMPRMPTIAPTAALTRPFATKLCTDASEKSNSHGHGRRSQRQLCPRRTSPCARSPPPSPPLRAARPGAQAVKHMHPAPRMQFHVFLRRQHCRVVSARHGAGNRDAIHRIRVAKRLQPAFRVRAGCRRLFLISAQKGDHAVNIAVLIVHKTRSPA